MECFVQGGRNYMGFFVQGIRNGMGYFVWVAIIAWDVLPYIRVAPMMVPT